MSGRWKANKLKAPKRIVPESKFEESWDVLAQAIHQIHLRNASQLSFEQLYRNAYLIVLSREGERLYDNVQRLVAEYLDEQVQLKIAPLIDEGSLQTANQLGQTEASAEFLFALKELWEFNIVSMRMIKDVLMYMDRVYVKSANVLPIFDAGLIIFRDHVVRSPQIDIQSRLVMDIINLIRAERNGDFIDRSAIRSATEMLNSLPADSGTVYDLDLEPAILESSRQFYEAERKRLLEEVSANEYLKRVEKRLNQEVERTQLYLIASTEPKLRSIVEEELIKKSLRSIAEHESGMFHMLDLDLMDDLKRMRLLECRVDMDQKVTKEFLVRRILDLGRAINAHVESEQVLEFNSVESGDPRSKPDNKTNILAAAVKWVQETLELKSKFGSILKIAYNNDGTIDTVVTEAFTQFINELGRCSEFLSLFVDDNLKKSLRGKGEVETDTILEQTVIIFRFIRDKDVFERYYKNHLAKRLLLKRSVSDDAERSMIAKLRTEAGASWTQKLEGMFRDMRLSQDIMREYEDRVRISDVRKPVGLAVSVLTSSYWPVSTVTVPKEQCIYPEEIKTAMLSFEAFYHSRHSGRQLLWNAALGTVDIRVKFKQRTHEINVSTYAMFVLLQFNHVQVREKLTFDVIKKRTGIPNDELKRTLQSLACAKYKILIKEPRSRDVVTSDSFAFNDKFTTPLARIKIMTIAQISKVETEEERKDTLNKVEDTRKHQTEAAIVRIMKSHRNLDHNNLIAEVTKQLASRFSPSPSLIKQRIEALIDREYIERTSENLKVYNYLVGIAGWGKKLWQPRLKAKKFAL